MSDTGNTAPEHDTFVDTVASAKKPKISEVEYNAFREAKRKAGTEINPELAICFVQMGHLCDPYMIGYCAGYGDECCYTGLKNFCARNPNGEKVCEEDMPKEIVAQLEKRPPGVNEVNFLFEQACYGYAGDKAMLRLLADNRNDVLSLLTGTEQRPARRGKI